MLTCDAQNRIPLSDIIAGVNTNESSITTTNGRVSTNEGDIVAIKSKDLEQDGRLDAIEASGVGGDVDSLIVQVNQNTADIFSNDGRISTNETNIGTNTTNVSTNATDIGLLDDRVVVLEALDFSNVITTDDVLGITSAANKVVTQDDVTNMLVPQVMYSSFIGQIRAATGVGGGTSVADVWTEREVTTISENSLGLSIVGGRIEIPAGDYEVTASCVATGAIHQSRIYDKTGSVELALGTLEAIATSATVSSSSTMCGRFTLGVTSSLTVETIVDTGIVDNGFGLPSPFGDGVFVNIKIVEV